MRILSKSVEARYFEKLGKSSDFPKDGYEGEYIADIAEGIINVYGKNIQSDDLVFSSFPENMMFEHIFRIFDGFLDDFRGCTFNFLGFGRVWIPFLKDFQ